MVSEIIRLRTYPLFSSTEFDHEFIIVVISLRLSALDMGHRYIMLLFKSREIKLVRINLHIDTAITNNQLKIITTDYTRNNKHLNESL